jgi:hypothetical protein
LKIQRGNTTILLDTILRVGLDTVTIREERREGEKRREEKESRRERK